jgi:AraC-like DNA-binding protein
LTYYLVKLLNLASKHERSLENCTRQYTLKTFVSHSKKNPPSPPFFFYISPLTLSKIQGQWLCSTPLLERRFKQSLGVCFYIVIELPFDSFQEKHKESDHVSCGFESPELIMYMQDISLFCILDWENICFQISHDGVLRWHHSVFHKRKSVLHFSAFTLKT